jgi:hypothetical protein
MGLLHFTHPFDAAPSREEVRVRLAALLGTPVTLEMEPPGFHCIVAGRNVVVLCRASTLEVHLRGLSRLSRGRAGRARFVCRALAALGGVSVPAPAGLLRFAFAGEPPSAEQVGERVARIRGALHPCVYPFDPLYELVVTTGAVRGRVTIHRAPGELTLEAALSSKLFGAACDAVTSFGREVSSSIPALGGRPEA